MMRLVIDMQGAQTESRFRGIGRYTLSMARAIAAQRTGDEIILALNGLFPETIEPIRSAFAALLPAQNICVWQAAGPVNSRLAGNDVRRATAQVLYRDFLNGLDADVIFVPSLFEGHVDDAVTGPDGCEAPTIVTVHDLIPLSNPAHYLETNPVYHQYYQRKIEALKRADGWIAISNYSRDEAIRLLGLDQSRITCVSEGCDAVFQPVVLSVSEKQTFLRRLGIRRDYVLYTGGADERKNLPRLLRAYAAMPVQLRADHQLVLAGKMPDGDIQTLRGVAAKAGLQSGEVVFTGYVDDAALAKLYSHCKLYVFPSWQEGFGLPALEAMSCDAPVIGANASSLPEVINNPDALFDPLDESSISDTMMRTLSDPALLQALREKGRIQARAFSWNTAAQQALDVLRGAARQAKPPRSWAQRHAWSVERYQNLLRDVARLEGIASMSVDDLKITANAIAHNSALTDDRARTGSLPERISWRIEGPFDSSYSLAILNRELARALARQGHDVALHSTEGPGDFAPDSAFLARHPDLAELHRRSATMPPEQACVSSRNIYPPRVADMRSRMNFLHLYAWEESGYPIDWVEDFNASLQGMTLVSEHVRKIMIDNGVAVPCSTVGVGLDHWSEIAADTSFRIQGKAFRFLHVSSCFPRKGVEAMLAAYGQAFTAHDPVTLVIKTFPNPHNKIRIWLDEARAAKADYPDVQIIEQDLDDATLKGIYLQCHALLAPSKAEGFGLPLAEAMLTDLPVITTGWGGQLDFCTPDTAWVVGYDFEYAQSHLNIFDSVWANPRVDDLKTAMLEVYRASPAERAARVERGKRLLQKRFSWDRVAARVVDAARRFATNPVLPNPRIGWVTTWNIRCGIATYSQHLIDCMPAGVNVLAARNSELTASDASNVTRCWDAAEHETLRELSERADELELDTLVLQFNYGFYNLEALNRFLLEQCDRGRRVMIVMHATVDPAHVPHKKLVQLREGLSRCDRIVVHALGDLNRLKGLGLVDNVMLFPHGIADHGFAPLADGAPNSSPARFEVGSYGFFLPHKGLLELIEAIALLRGKGHDVHLKMVNAEYPAPESTQLIEQARRRVVELGVQNAVTLHTRFLPDAESLALLRQTHAIAYPYQTTGESASGAVRYGLAAGVPVIVSPLAIFEDVGPAVFRFPGTTAQDIAAGLENLMDMRARSDAALQEKQGVVASWRQAHLYSRLARRLHGTLTALHGA